METGAVKAEPAEAEGGVIGIHHSAVHGQLGAEGIEGGAVGAPQLGAADHGAGRGGHRRTCAHGDGGAGAVAGLHHRVGHGDGSGCVAVVDHVHGGAHGAVAAGDVGGGHIGAVQVHMDRIGNDEGHIPVNAAAGIPTAGGDGIHSLHGHHVFGGAVAGQVFGNVKGEGGVAIVVLAHQGAVDVNVSVGVDAVKVQHHGLAGVGFRQGEGLAVPAGAAGEEAALRLSAGGKGLRNAEIVRQRHGLPAGVVEVHVLGGAAGTQIELPSFVEVVRPAEHAAGERCGHGITGSGASFCRDGSCRYQR